MMVWSDSNMHNRNTGTENCRTSGKVDPVRIKKDVFYTMQTIQSTTPKLHIVGHWNYPQLSDDTYNYPLKSYNGTYWEETGETNFRDAHNKTANVILRTRQFTLSVRQVFQRLNFTLMIS